MKELQPELYASADPVAMVRAHLAQVERCLALAERADARSYCPHPLVTARAEAENAMRILAVAARRVLS